MAVPTIHTYHCLCTSLLLSSTHTLSSLPRRASPSLDNAIILPLPPPPTTSFPPQSPIHSDHEEDDGRAGDLDTSTRVSTNPIDALPPLGYTVLLSMTPDRRPTIVRREDGFEKRYLYRCGRCRLVVGYELDEAHYSESNKGDAMDIDALQNAEGRTKMVYLLPGGMMNTDVMASGKKITEGEVTLDQKSKAIAAWE